MKIELIESGYFLADGGAMFGAIPKAAWKRRYPCNDENQCRLTMRCVLVRTGCGRVILIDPVDDFEPFVLSLQTNQIVDLAEYLVEFEIGRVKGQLISLDF
jgi:hypothetical protein